MDALARNGGAATLKLLSAETGLHPSTAFRILASAVENGLVVRGEAGRYRLGPRLVRWGGMAREGLDLRGIARPEMERLRDQVQETVNLTVQEDDEVVYVERVSPRRMMRVEQVIGSRAPLHVTAVGKLMLAEGGEAAARGYARRTGLPAFTDHSHTRFPDLWRESADALARGYALDNEEAEPGVGCIGALVRDAAGRVVAGLSVSAPMERRQDGWIELVTDAALRISQRLGLAAARKAESGP